ncbi:MAG: hypothetical protein NE328_03030 [Lentisphaeraceae bacterium]|nr:hypothetical protein [Lentisphaeraceae bacterium]
MQTAVLSTANIIEEINTYANQGDIEQAITLTRKALRENKNSTVLHNKAAELYLELKHFSKSEYHSYLSYKEDKNLNALILLVTSLVYEGKFPEAIAFGTDYITNISPRIEVKNILDQILDYLLDLKKDSSLSVQEELNIIEIYKAYGEYDIAAKYIESLSDQALKLSERKILCDLWRPMMNTRRFINPDYSIEEFFTQLKKLKVKYTVLRWFEDLPNIEQGEDIDFLIADEDIDKFSTLLVPYPYNNAQKIDLYSASGLPGSAYQALPYFQTNLAKQILNNRILYKNLYFIPSPKDHFYSLTYHAVYHKAETSGLPIDSDGQLTPGEHNYDKVIKNLASKVNIKIEDTSLNSLHGILKSNGWTPSIDLIRKLGHNKSPWLQSLHPGSQRSSSMAVFILRDWAKGKNLVSVLNKWFDAEGISVLHFEELSKSKVAETSEILRGGNWGQGPYPVCGGKPYAAFVLLDQSPIAADEKTKKSHPFVNNLRFREVKSKLRDFVNQKLPKDKRTNCLHCCDDDEESWEYIDLLFPDKKEALKKKQAQLEKSFSSSFKTIKDLTNNARRAKVELIEYNSSKAILKTFKLGKERFFKRELTAYTGLSDKVEFISKPLYTDELKLVLPYIEHDSDKQASLLKENLGAVAQCAYQMWKAGYAHLDFQPGNFIFDCDGKAHLIDFEMLYKYKDKPKNVYDSYDVAGIPSGFKWDLLGGNINEHKNRMWKEATGFTMTEILDLYLQ